MRRLAQVLEAIDETSNDKTDHDDASEFSYDNESYRNENHNLITASSKNDEEIEALTNKNLQ